MAPQILAKRHAHVLAQFAASDVVVALDYDGTLAPIVATPRKARMRARTRQLLAAVAQRYPCVVISGRARDDVSSRVGSVPVWHVSGNHGLEPWGEDASYVRRVRAWVGHLQNKLALLDGVVVEDKTYSVTVHYRRAKHKRRALRVVGAAVRTLRGARVIGGNEAINVVPRGAPHKGEALERARRLLACEKAIYVGDDETDEDAFAAARPDRLLSVRIGTARHSRARFRLKDQRQIDRFLRTLLTLRPRRTPQNSHPQS
jgi:trehalose 6-phosphate phosphatase